MVLCMCQWCCVCVSGAISVTVINGVMHVSVVLCMCQWCYACVSGVVYVSVVLYMYYFHSENYFIISKCHTSLLMVSYIIPLFTLIFNHAKSRSLNICTEC